MFIESKSTRDTITISEVYFALTTVPAALQLVLSRLYLILTELRARTETAEFVFERCKVIEKHARSMPINSTKGVRNSAADRTFPRDPVNERCYQRTRVSSVGN